MKRNRSNVKAGTHATIIRVGKEFRIVHPDREREVEAVFATFEAARAYLADHGVEDAANKLWLMSADTTKEQKHASEMRGIFK